MKLVCLLLLAATSLYDMRTRKIPVMLIALTAVLSLVEGTIILTDHTGTPLQIFGALLPGAALVALSLISAQSIGLGDGLLIAAAGPVFGGYTICAGVMLAFFFSAVVSLVLMVWKRADKKMRIPFVPFLASAMGVVTVAMV